MNIPRIAIALTAISLCMPLIGPRGRLFADDDVVALIARAVAEAESAPPTLFNDIRAGIAKDRARVLRELLPKLKQPSIGEAELTIYVWALGEARDSAAVPALADVHRKSDSEMVRQNCVRALATIGGQKAEELLLSVHDSSKDTDERYMLLNFLAQMKCAGVPSRAEYLLVQDKGGQFWQPIFVFGKLGDKGVPFLLKQLGHDNRAVRITVVNLLGRWLIATEATGPLQERFWVEQDPEIRKMILGAIYGTTPELANLAAFLRRIVAKEEEGELADLAKKSLEMLDQVRADAISDARQRKPNEKAFQRECEKLLKSAGKEGDYEVLENASTMEDEPALRLLRERIYQRDSDEAFHDVQKVNAIIIHNRWIKNLAKK